MRAAFDGRLYRPFSALNPLPGCNSGKALLIRLTRLFYKQPRTSTSTKRLVRVGSFFESGMFVTLHGK